jgi:hypothetical protein
MVSPCSLSEFSVQVNPETFEYVVSKVDYFTAYRTGIWELKIGSETRNIINPPVKFVEPCK